MSKRLKEAAITMADGFSLNVSNFVATKENLKYGRELSQKLGGAHFVIDTGRSGSGTNGQWCNPQGRSLGEAPTLNTGEKNVDAFLWIKPPGESDGNCNGGPSAGTFWADYALGLAPGSAY
jgi:endoglucanase